MYLLVFLNNDFIPIFVVLQNVSPTPYMYGKARPAFNRPPANQGVPYFTLVFSGLFIVSLKSICAGLS